MNSRRVSLIAARNDAGSAARVHVGLRRAVLIIRFCSLIGDADVFLRFFQMSLRQGSFRAGLWKSCVMKDALDSMRTRSSGGNWRNGVSGSDRRRRHGSGRNTTDSRYWEMLISTGRSLTLIHRYDAPSVMHSSPEYRLDGARPSPISSCPWKALGTEQTSVLGETSGLEIAQSPFVRVEWWTWRPSTIGQMPLSATQFLQVSEQLRPFRTIGLSRFRIN